MQFRRLKNVVKSSSAICAVTLYSAPAFAQSQTDDDFLGTVVLGESKREVQTQTATPVTRIDQTEIDDRQPGTIAELIDSVPGVNLVNGSTPQGSGINIRGFGANNTFGTDQKVAVQVDGASVGAEELYRIGTQLFTDPELYREAEVIRGTVGSFEYGSGIVGGVVRLETKNASDFTGGEPGFKFRQSLQFSTNGDGITSSSIFAYQPSQNFEILGNFVRRSQDFQDDGNGDEIGASEFDLPSGLIKARLTFGQDLDQTLTFSLSRSETEESDVPYDTFLTSDDIFGNVDREVESTTAVIAYNYNPADNDLINLDVNLSYADQVIDQEYVDGSSSCENFGCDFPFPDGGFPTVNADQEYETTKLTIRNTALFSTGAIDHNLRTGIEFARRERKDAAAAPGGTDDRFALFAVNEMQIGEAWTVTPAIRYESSSIDGSTAPNDGNFDNDALMGGLSVRYAFGNGFAVFGSAAYTESLPIIDDLGNTDLMEQSEKARTFELGASFDGDDVFQSGDTFAIKANLYQTELWDVTSYTVAGAPMGTNPDSIDTRGIEIEASYAMATGLYVDLNANIADGDENPPSGDRIDWRGTPADSLQLTVGRKFGEELDLSWELVADREKDTNGVTTPGFAVHNLRATYIPQSGVLEGTELRLGIENAFDYDYTRHLSTRPAPGRNIKFGIAKTF